MDAVYEEDRFETASLCSIASRGRTCDRHDRACRSSRLFSMQRHPSGLPLFGHRERGQLGIRLADERERYPQRSDIDGHVLREGCRYPVTNVYSTVEKTGSPYWYSAGGYTDFWVNITARVPNSTGAVTVTAAPRIRAYPDGNWNEWNYCAGCGKYSVTWVKGYKRT